MSTHDDLTAARGFVADASNAIADTDGNSRLTAISSRLDDLMRELDDLLLDDGAIDEAYERAAARARSDDFAATGGKDWT